MSKNWSKPHKQTKQAHFVRPKLLKNVKIAIIYGNVNFVRASL